MEPDDRDLDKRWAVRGAAYLLVAFLLPLVAGVRWIFFPTLIDQSPPAVRLLVLAPAILGALALLLALKTEGLARAVGLLLTTGLTIIICVGTVEALMKGALAQAMPGARGPVALPTPRSAATMLVYQVAMTLAFVGAAFTRAREDSALGPRLSGVCGAVLLALHFVPGEGGMAIEVLGQGMLWQHLWFAPLTVVASLGFAGANLTQLFGLYEHDDLAKLALLLGAATLLIGPFGLVWTTFWNSVALTGTVLSVVIKGWGGFVALHILMAAGVLGLLLHGLAPEAEAEAR
ncbi:MAG: hypothetical protein H6704_03600 [Myxococcales bacterium]|nr:hypothetical protein [Myxococcales bacterium]MCB9535324.1 hypothetical protein [Myxococcales bacterium]